MSVFDKIKAGLEEAIDYERSLQRTELIDGTSITTSIPPRNEKVAQRFFNSIASQIGEQGKVFLRPHVFLDDQNCFIPDVAVVCDPTKVRDDGIHGPPDFVVEIIVAATELVLRSTKKQAYAKFRVKELWIVDAHANTVEAWVGKDVPSRTPLTDILGDMPHDGDKSCPQE